MNPSTCRFLVFAAVGLFATGLSSGSANPAVPATVSTKAVARSQHIKERIDSLFKRRQNPEPLPVILPNPFLVVGGAMDNGRSDNAEQNTLAEATDATGPTTASSSGKAIEESAPTTTTDADALARYITAIKIGGTVQLNGELRVIINQAPRKEGDLIFMDKKDAVIYLRVVHITATELTLSFNDAVQTIRLRN